jgi:ribosomal protein L11 methyltransferase
MNERTERYPFVAIDVPASLAEVAAEQLFELGAEGVEQRDRTTLKRGGDLGADVAAPQDPGAIDDEETITLVAAFATHDAAHEAIDAFDAELNPRLEEVVGDAWRDAWKEHFAPFRLSPRIVIKPPWREVDAALLSDAPHVLELEPGRAFGTGLHATTSLVARVLDARSAEFRGKELLDVGTGSGILALVALLLGAARVIATDIDADAVRVAVENAERAGLASRLSATATPIEDVEGRYPIVLANIQAEVLVPLAKPIAARVADQGLLVLSGVLVEQQERVRAAYPDFALEETLVEGEWVALVLRAR